MQTEGLLSQPLARLWSGLQPPPGGHAHPRAPGVTATPLLFAICVGAGVLALGAARPRTPAAGWGLTCLLVPGVVRARRRWRTPGRRSGGWRLTSSGRSLRKPRRGAGPLGSGAGVGPGRCPIPALPAGRAPGARLLQLPVEALAARPRASSQRPRCSAQQVA